MRARNIKPGFFMNEEIGELDSSCRLLFIGLWCMADRDGFLKNRPKRIWAELFPYNQTFISKVCPWLDNLASKNLIRFWCNDEGEKVVIEIINFLKHQKPHRREKESEIKPLIDGSVLSLSEDGPRCPERGKRNEERGLGSITGRSSGNPTPDQDEKVVPVLSIPLCKKNTEFHIFDEDVAQWQESFPGIDVNQELKRIKQWSIDNPKRRKTQAGIRNHISSWLGREQNKTRGQPRQTKTARQNNIDQISDVREAIEHGTGFSPYKETAEENGSGHVNQDRLALPE